jgi:DNA processing protein
MSIKVPDNVQRLCPGERGYPELLAMISDPPAELYVRGALPREPGIAMVGSRRCTAYGRRIAYRLAIDVARCGFAVISGLARGIDAAAHRGALDGGGRTVAVLPTGIDTIYPPSHEHLARQIARTGALVTEFEPGTPVFPSNFHQRNRIIAGLAAAVVVVEAAHQSGTKITVKFALDYNRDVLAVPGPIDSRTSQGANGLIVEGAALCSGIDSILAHLPEWAKPEAEPMLETVRAAAAKRVANLDAVARSVFEAVPADTGCSVEYLVAATGLPVPALLAALTDVEARGLIRSIGGRRYERV